MEVLDCKHHFGSAKLTWTNVRQRKSETDDKNVRGGLDLFQVIWPTTSTTTICNYCIELLLLEACKEMYPEQFPQTDVS